jgi:hypothetical protein
MSKIQINNEVRDMTAEEQAKFDADVVARQTQKSTEIAEIEANDTLKASAKAKLIAGEALTEDEANTIVL